MQEFVKNMYAAGQAVLSSKDSQVKVSNKEDRKMLSELSVQCNVACIELLLWAIREDSGGLISRVRNLKFATYLKFATGENTNKINELW